jgi:alpha-L-fucosidase
MSSKGTLYLNIPDPQPYGPLPSPRQLAWHALEFYGFLHFTVNTFSDLEWGYGDEPPDLFTPTDFDPDQIARAAAAGGMAGLILTCKHHDGFCLWPSNYTRHSVASSLWRGGQGDVVSEIAAACRRHGLKFGVYLSPWDRNRADYGTPAYVDIYRRQLRELLENYGSIFEVWLDGANGGDGFYGGARETRTIDKHSYYGWPETWDLVRRLQPEACIFSDAGPDLRWVGNEQGKADETCWATLNRDDFAPGEADPARLNRGDRPGSHWVPAECDVSIRPGWFYHAAEDGQVKNARELADLYFDSVGRGGSLLLNLPPDRRGQVHPRDVAVLAAFHSGLENAFAQNLAGAAIVSALARGAQQSFGPRNLLDGSPESYWTVDDDLLTPVVTLSFAKALRFNVVGLREYLPLGQRVEGFEVDTWQGGQWQPLTSGSSIGPRRLLRTPQTITDAVRLRITQAAACPALTEIGLWQQDEDLWKI